MIKFAKIIDEQTKECQVGLGTNAFFYKSIGMQELDVEQAYNGKWFLIGYAPNKPAEQIKAEEIIALKDELAATDYKIIKCSEYNLAGAPLPYDIEALHANRQRLRDRINELEA